MADYGWASIRMWPWNDAWIATDEGLRDALRGLDLAVRENGVWELRPGTDGDICNEELASDPVFVATTLSGSFRGGAWEIQESPLLDALTARGIAWCVDSDPAYDWDGDLIYWHPGMEERWQAPATTSSAVIDRSVYDAMVEKTWPWSVRVAALDEPLRNLQARLDLALAEKRNGVKPNEYVIESYRWNIAALEERRAKLRTEKPKPRLLDSLVREFFDAASLATAWLPPSDWAPKLVLEEDAS